MDYYIAEIVDNNTGKNRFMSIPAIRPLMFYTEWFGHNDKDGGTSVVATMVNNIVNGNRPAPELVDKWQCINWIAEAAKCDLPGITAAVAVVDKKTYRKFNKRFNKKTTSSWFFENSDGTPHIVDMV
jgi:hypothetical protein